LIKHHEGVSEVGDGAMKIPIVECWHAEPIPIASINRVLVIRNDPKWVRTLRHRCSSLPEFAKNYGCTCLDSVHIKKYCEIHGPAKSESDAEVAGGPAMMSKAVW
jgi:hypothetical protein